jgi:hypothetical protein
MAVKRVGHLSLEERRVTRGRGMSRGLATARLVFRGGNAMMMSTGGWTWA